MSGQIAVVTGAASGIGRAIATRLAKSCSAVALVDMDERVREVAVEIAVNSQAKAVPFVGSATDPQFRKAVFDEMTKQHGVPTICVPAAGITRDGLAVKIDKETGEPQLYPQADFELVLSVNLTAPVYWAMETIARIAKAHGKWTPGDALRGSVVFIGSVSSQGNKGQVSYSATKRALVAVAATLTSEGMFYGVKCGVVHPGFTETPMVKKMKPEIIEKGVLPATQMKRLIEPEEIAEAVCFMASNPMVTGEIWVDAGWHPSP